MEHFFSFAVALGHGDAFYPLEKIFRETLRIYETAPDKSGVCSLTIKKEKTDENSI